MVVSIVTVGFGVKRILVDSENEVKVLSWEAYQKMGLKEQVLSKASPLYDFVNHPVEVKGSISLPNALGDGEHSTTEYVQFYMVDHQMAYNTIFGRSIMKMARMVVVTFCMKIKFPTKNRVEFL